MNWLRSSLRLKLLLGFGLASLLGLALLAILSVNVALKSFRLSVGSDRLERYAARALEYYQLRGTWQGIEAAVPAPSTPLRLRPPPPTAASNIPPNALPTPETVKSPKVPPSAPTSPVPPPPSAASIVSLADDPASKIPLRMGLVDAERRIIIPVMGTQVGQIVNLHKYSQQKDLMVDGQLAGTVIRVVNVDHKNPEEQAFLSSLYRTLPMAGGLALILALGLGLFMAQSLTKPLRRLTKASKTLAQGALGETVPVKSQDEVGKLTQAFNQMSQELAEANRYRRQMTADVVHDLATPLSVLSGYLDSFLKGAIKPLPQNFKTLQEETLLLKKLVEDLRLLSLADTDQIQLKCEEIVLEDFLTSVLHAFQPAAEANNIKLSLDIDKAPLSLKADRERLRQVLNNLINNALRHTPCNGSIKLIVTRATNGVLLQVQDTGEGISAENLPHIFERFYRADLNRSQTNDLHSGLGLAITKSLVELHKGFVTAESKLGFGTTFSVHLPSS